ncbi:TRAP transporter large permease [bacterium]|nr:MAG: TRAP transporter large permease [bacterium]
MYGAAGRRLCQPHDAHESRRGGLGLIAIGLALLAFLIFLGAPLFLAIGIPAIVLLIFGSTYAPNVIATVFQSTISNSVFIAIPLFVLTGKVMTASGAARRLTGFFESLLCHLPGGMAIVSIVSSVFFGAMTGSSIADTTAVGTIMIPAMVETGYSRRFAASVVAAGGCLGILFPPGIPLILFGAISQVSIARLFQASLVPGVFVAAILTAVAVVVAARGEGKRLPARSWGERFSSFRDALPALLLPVVVLGGIYLGLVTITEAATLAAAYAIIIAATVYRELSFSAFIRQLVDTAQVTSMIMFIVASSAVLAFYLIQSQAPQHLAAAVVGSKPSLTLFLLATNAAFLILGFILEPPAIIYLTVPLFVPLLAVVGVNPLHFAIIMILAMQIGLVHPPIGLNLFVVSGISKEPVETISLAVLPFLAALFVALVVVNVIPGVTLALPGLMR